MRNYVAVELLLCWLRLFTPGTPSSRDKAIDLVSLEMETLPARAIVVCFDLGVKCVVLR